MLNIHDSVMYVAMCMPMKCAYVIHVPIGKQPIRLTYSHMTNIYIYVGRPLERLGFFINTL